MPRTVSVPSVIGETQPIIRIVEVLPAPFGPRKPKASPRRDVEIDRVDGRELAEALCQAAGMDERGLEGSRHGRASYRDGASGDCQEAARAQAPG